MSLHSRIDAAFRRIDTAADSLYGLPNGFASYVVSRYALTQTPSALVVVCPTHREMEAAAAEFGLYMDESRIRLFPNWEVLPYDDLSPDKATVCTRLKTLKDISERNGLIVVTTVRAYYSRLLPPTAIKRCFKKINRNVEIPPAELASALVLMGYARVDKVEEYGEFSLRGDIMDIFPGAAEHPVRIDFFDNTIERLRTFNSETQRGIDEIDSITVFAVHEVIPDPTEKNRAIDYLKQHKKNIDAGFYNELFQKIMTGIPFNGIEPIFPLFFRTSSYLNDHFFETPTVFFKQAEYARRVHQEVYEEIADELELTLKQNKITLPLDTLFFAPKSGHHPPRYTRRVNLCVEHPDSADPDVTFDISDNSLIGTQFADVDSGKYTPAIRILNGLASIANQGGTVVVMTANDSQVALLCSYFEDRKMIFSVIESPFEQNPDFLDVNHGGLMIVKNTFGRGFQQMDGNRIILCFIAADEIYLQNASHRKKKKTYRQVMRELDKINTDDYVVHEDYGIGIYRGLKKIALHGDEGDDFLIVEFKNQDKIYVPVDNAGVLSRWSGISGGKPSLNLLGDKSWQKTKIRVLGKVEDMAEELINLYAKRKMASGIAFEQNHSQLDEFQVRFEFQETEDQLEAIKEIYRDMAEPTPMDRLICGDVGFGKTEIAMRAICKAVLSQYQAAVLVPTTVLAAQHFETFKERFSFMPVNIGILSRMQSNAEIKETLLRVAEGKIDILVGTHRILSKDIAFKKLGLLIIDEEQRFGVKDKEKIRQLRVNVDTLTLTATPIPRTLHMSLMGIRDISIINTPPVERRSIKTRVIRYNTHVIAEAVEREIRRGGQVFFIHNRVQDIELIRTQLLEFMPHVDIRVAHGQMTGNRLERVMIDFMRNQFTVLLATTIVESGLDIPNANTIIVNNADRFGLAQLYQLRGRVGRAQRQAYSYFMVKDEGRLSEVALKRLNVIREMTELGSGFKISSYDLEIRGAGNMLGSEQSGDVDGIGINLYIAMIEEAVERIRGQNVHLQKSAVTIDSAFPASIPETFIESMQLRMELYREIAGCVTENDVGPLLRGITDRFGSVPETVENLIHISVIKQTASDVHATELKLSRKQTAIKFSDLFQPDPVKLFSFISANAGRLRPNNSLELPNTSGSLAGINFQLNSLKNAVGI